MRSFDARPAATTGLVAGACGPARNLACLEAKQNRTMRCGIVVGEARGYDRSHEGETASICIWRSQLGIEQLHMSFHHHAVPVEQVAHFIGFERTPAVPGQGGKLAAPSRSTVQPRKSCLSSRGCRDSSLLWFMYISVNGKSPVLMRAPYCAADPRIAR